MYRNYTTEIESVQATALTLARSTAHDAVKLIDDAHYVLDQLIDRPLVRTLDPDQCDPILHQLPTWHGQFANLTALDKTGQIICNSHSAKGEKLPNYSDHEWFVRVLNNRAFTVGTPRLGGMTRLWIVPLVVPIRLEDGEVVGALSMSVNLSRFKPQFVRREFPSGAEVSIVDSAGTYVTTSLQTDEDNWLGQQIPDPALLSMVINAGDRGETSIHYRGADGIDRAASLTHVPGTDWRAIATIPTNEVIANARTIAILNMLTVVLVLAAATAAATFLIRKIEGPIFSIAATAQAHIQGDATARAIESGPREIAAVANQFNRMLDARRDAEGEQKRAENDLRQRNYLFDTALENMPHGLCMFDAGARLLVCNRSYANFYGLTLEQTKPGTPLRAMLEAQVPAICDPQDGARYIEECFAAIATHQISHTVLKCRDGRVIAVDRQPMAGGGWVAVLQDISEQKRAEAEILHLALHDALTNLPNRTLFRKHVDQALMRWRREGEPFILLLLDLDHFKAINDTLGHAAGDCLVRLVAGRLTPFMRDSNVVARLGGDEFAMVQTVSGDLREGAAMLANQLLQTIGEPFDLDGHQAIVETSIGIAMAPTDGTDTDQLLKNADLALYSAKSAGRNVFRFFEPRMGTEARLRYDLEADLRSSLALGEFQLHYQPVVDTASMDMCGVEALVRWFHPRRGTVLPGEFIPLAESTGLIVPLGEWVLRQACAEAVDWPADVRVAVNLSPIQFRKGNIVDIVTMALLDAGLPPARLELEITESVLLQTDETNLDKLHQLKKLGVSVVLDDFGTGYSSLRYLQMFPFDKIKIDRSFVSEIATRSDCAAIVCAAIGLAKSLNVTTTAEGVETAEQFELLRAAGCGQAQGYLFGRPCKASELQFIRSPKDKGQAA